MGSCLFLGHSENVIKHYSLSLYFSRIGIRFLGMMPFLIQDFNSTVLKQKSGIAELKYEFIFLVLVKPPKAP